MKTIHKHLAITIITAVCASTLQVKAQNPDRLQPTWWFGVSGAANFAFYQGSAQSLGNSKMPYTFSNGHGVAPYVSIFAEYRPDPVWGLMLNLAMDNNHGVFDHNNAPSNVSASFKADFNYVSLEPSLRIAPFSGNFYLFAGPRLSYNVTKSYDFRVSNEQDDANKFTDVNSLKLSAQLGAGYEIPLSLPRSTTQVDISPFVAVVPYFGDVNRSNELTLTTIRAGIAIKIGSAPEPPMPQAALTPIQEKDIQLAVEPPKYVPTPNTVNENLPIANAVFFDQGNTSIPSRYTLLTKDQAAGFTEDQLKDCQKTAGTRSDRQLKVYYNVLNILGNRMREYPESTIKLVGSSGGKGEEIGEENATSVKNYLVNNFGIDAARIETEGRNKPIIPSEKYNTTNDIDLTRAEDNRVDIVSTSPELMVEAIDNAALCAAPVAMAMDGSSPGDARIIISANGADGNLLYWSIDVKDDSGNVQHFGTFSGDMGTISSAALLKDKKSGNYTIVLNGENYLGHTITKESSFSLKSEEVLPAQQEQTSSILFDFDKSKAVSNYQNFLTNSVASLIPSGATVVISGHTDIVGTDEHNMNLSIARANETQSILNDALNKAGKTGITYQTTGYGENNPEFNNSLPEERFYNRTVTIEIIPPGSPVAIR
ncbi:MAG TPA: OmpA family protein [Bacteroidia bacterium]|jgi:outer membrane protein OmpA-like peptidoglycan-associated protein|nr:OmpA family protein [Bacteroidia bacterium]